MVMNFKENKMAFKTERILENGNFSRELLENPPRKMI